MYDFIIVGAGIYGKIIAFLLHNQGFKTLLLEKKNINKIKLENIVITNSTYSKLSRLLNIDLNKFINKKIDKIYLNEVKINTNNIVLNLKKLELHLIELYKKNKGKLIDKVKIEKYDYKNNQLIILNKKYKYNNLIAADGTLSEVRLNLTQKIQKFKFVMLVKNKKIKKEFIFNYNKNYKTLEKIVPTRGSNLITISNHKTKNKIFRNYEEIKQQYNYMNTSKTGYFIPDNDLLFKIKNIYFIGDASGMIDPLTNTSVKYNLMYIESLLGYFIDNKIINYKKINRDIIFRKIIKHGLYFPLINKLMLKIVIKKYKEDLC